MNAIKLMTRLTAVAVLLASASGVAQARVVTDSNTATAQQTLQFAASGDASITLTAKTGLKSGIQASPTVVATGTATSDKAGNQVAIRWTPLTGTVYQGPAVSNWIDIHGKNTGEVGTFIFTGATQSVDDPTYWYDGSGTIDISVFTPQGSNIAADTYTLSMDAAVWSE